MGAAVLWQSHRMSGIHSSTRTCPHSPPGTSDSPVRGPRSARLGVVELEVRLLAADGLADRRHAAGRVVAQLGEGPGASTVVRPCAAGFVVQVSW